MPGHTQTQQWWAAVGPSWVEVDLDAIVENLEVVRRVVGRDRRVLGVVKADAYGHGASAVALALEASGIEAFGVSTVAEALGLRAAGVACPILVFTPPRLEDLPGGLEGDLTFTVTSLEGARALAEAASRRSTPATAHLKVDTGMGRYGFAPADLGPAAAELLALGPAVRWEGLYTHMARGVDPEACRRQLRRLETAAQDAAARRLRPPLRHAAASAALLCCPEARLDMVRVGNLLYGEVPVGAPRPEGLRRAFAMRATPGEVRELPAGATVGYASAWRARRPTRVTVLPVGFADGLDLTPAGPYRRVGVLVRALARAVLGLVGLGGRLLGAAAGEVEIGGRRVPVLGRVGMQQVTLDVSALPTDRPLPVASVHILPTMAAGYLPRVYLRDGVAIAARTPSGPLQAAPAPATEDRPFSGR